MENCYEVFFGKELVGKVQLLREGLYYRVICRCEVSGKQIYRLFAQVGAQKLNLGVLIPDGNGLYLSKKIPVKRFNCEIPVFTISSGCLVHQEVFVPIRPEEPFLYIDRLKNSFLQTESGKIGIRIKTDPEAV